METLLEKDEKHFNFKHGFGHTLIYARWRGMMLRCYDKSSPKYHRYGARGIVVCERWHDVTNFVSDMVGPPFPGATIDRINNDGPYSPENCRWSSQKEQQGNRGNNFIVTYLNQTRPAVEWAKITGIPAKIIAQRIRRDKWTVEKALTKSNKNRWGSAPTGV